MKFDDNFRVVSMAKNQYFSRWWPPNL